MNNPPQKTNKKNLRQLFSSIAKTNVLKITNCDVNLKTVSFSGFL